MSPASMAVCCVERSPASSFSKRTSWPTLGGRETCCWSASQRSSFARVALRGTEPLRKFRRPFGLMEIAAAARRNDIRAVSRSEEHTSELQSRENLVCRLLLEKKKKENTSTH